MDVSSLLDALRSLLDSIQARVASTPTPALPAAALLGLLLAWKAYRAFGLLRAKSLIRTIPGPANPSWLAGNLPEVYDVLNIRWHHEATQKYEGVFQINGMFGDEQLYITDPRAMYQVLVKEQAIFEEPKSLLVMNRALLGDGLLATIGEQHKRQRKVLNPFFSEKHMRDLLPIFWPVASKVCDVWTSKLNSGASVQTLNVYLWASRAGLEFIARGGLGTSLDALDDGGTSTFTELVKEMVPTLSRLHVPMQLLPIFQPLFAMLPEWLGSALLRNAPFAAVRTLKRITDSFEGMARDIVTERRAAVLAELKTSERERARDLLSLLLRAQMDATASDSLPEQELYGDITTIVFGAQDTSASATSRALQRLAENPSAQARLRAEVRGLRDGSESSDDIPWDYDALMRLPYLDAVVRETLRLHGPVSWIWRIARNPTSLPLRRPVALKDGSSLTSIPVARNQGVIIGIAAAHRDTSVWGADAVQWRPERWLGAASVAVDDDFGTEAPGKSSAGAGAGAMLLDEGARYPGVYSGMMTFSGGGRACIGFKFALLSMKLVIARLVDRFEFALPDEEIVWNMNHIAAPTVKGRESEGAQMPLKVSLAA